MKKKKNKQTLELHTDSHSFLSHISETASAQKLTHMWGNKRRYPSLTLELNTSLPLLSLTWHQKQELLLTTVALSLFLFLLLLGDLLLASRCLGFGRLDLGAGDLWSRKCLRRLLGLLGLLGVGTERGSAARDVDVLPVVRNMLQGELGTVACAQAHGSRTQCVSGLTHFCTGKRRKQSIEYQYNFQND